MIIGQPVFLQFDCMVLLPWPKKFFITFRYSIFCPVYLFVLFNVFCFFNFSLLSPVFSPCFYLAVKKKPCVENKVQAGRGYTPVIELQKPAIAGIIEDAFRCKDHTARGYYQTIQNKQCWSKPLKNNKERKNRVLVYQNKTDLAVKNRYRNTRALLVLAGPQARWLTSALRTGPWIQVIQKPWKILVHSTTSRDWSALFNYSVAII